MLVLSRQNGERILIGDDIEVMVVSIREDKVRLGISAPRTLSVDRPEVRAAKLDPISAAVADERRNIGGDPNYGKDSK